MQPVAEKFRHGILHEFVRDGLFRLVFIRGLRGEAVRHQHQTVGHILERDFGFGLGVFVCLLAVGIDGVDKGVFYCFFRRAAVLEP